MTTSVTDYVKSGIDEIEGWLQPPAVELISILSEVQESFGVKGGAAEIGVHHGKLFILLCLLKKGSSHVAFDVFENQDLNTDKSGCGNRDIFDANLKKYGLSDSVAICKKDSLRIRESDIERLREKHGEFSVFSVDGSHTTEHTLNDMIVAEKMLGPGGLMIIDDYQNINWPGVIEGVDRYFRDHSYKMLPLCAGFNKLILVDFAYHARYLRRFNENTMHKHEEWYIKPVKRFGHDGLSIHKLP